MNNWIADGTSVTIITTEYIITIIGFCKYLIYTRKYANIVPTNKYYVKLTNK